MSLQRVVVVVLLCALGTVFRPADVAAQETTNDSAQLRRLLHFSDEALLDRNPIFGLYRGDTRRAAIHGDYISRAYVDAERLSAESELAQLAQIRRDRLSPVDRVAYDTFRWSREGWRDRHSLPAAAIWPMLKLDQMNGWHLFFPELSSGEGVAPYKTVADYDSGLARIDGFVEWLDRAVDRMREGQREGVVLPRIVVERVISQFDKLAEQGIGDSPYYGPIRKLPPEMAAADRERLTLAYAESVERRLRPAFRRVRAFLTDDYLPSARATVGLSAIPGGAAYYAFLIRSNTTTSMSAQEVHDLGLKEVARITAGMTAVLRKLSYQGSLPQFFEYVQTDPRFEVESAQVLAERYADIGRRVDAGLPRLFDTRPKTPLAIRPTPAIQSPTDPAARYTPGSADTGKPGVFHFNTFALPTRRIWQTETLYLHEAVPGHHMQVALAAENLELPKLLRFDGNTAYAEGWALYAESLGPELGLFADPFQLFGHYNDEMLRAMRLVVDSGIHAYGWSRERAIDYMRLNSAMSRSDASAEVERYIADPGQALAYKVGALTIQRLRMKGEQALRGRFDIREFHRQILDTGNVPMAVLEAKIDEWIAVRANTSVGLK